MRSINDLSCAPAMPPTSGMIPLSSVAAAPRRQQDDNRESIA
jgi:hypothetical protein